MHRAFNTLLDIIKRSVPISTACARILHFKFAAVPSRWQRVEDRSAQNLNPIPPASEADVFILVLNSISIELIMEADRLIDSTYLSI